MRKSMSQLSSVTVSNTWRVPCAGNLILSVLHRSRNEQGGEGEGLPASSAWIPSPPVATPSELTWPQSANQCCPWGLFNVSGVQRDSWQRLGREEDSATQRGSHTAAYISTGAVPCSFFHGLNSNLRAPTLLLCLWDIPALLRNTGLGCWPTLRPRGYCCHSGLNPGSPISLPQMSLLGGSISVPADRTLTRHTGLGAVLYSLLSQLFLYT